LFGGTVGKDTVSRTWRKVKSDWDAWNTRSLAEDPIVRLILDGTVVRVRLDRKATSISLEIGEAALTEGGETTRATMAELQGMGCQVGIAGFGTGYSSLTYLRRLPIDFLKVDASFIRGLGRNAEDETIVDAVIKLAQALSLTSLADGVDTADQEHTLRRLGCHLAQGVRFGPAGPPEELVLSSQA